MNNTIRQFLLSLTVFLSICLPTWAEGADVVVVTTYSRDYQWSSIVIEHITESVRDNGLGTVSSFYLPIENVHTRADMDSLVADLHEIFLEENPKSVILVGSASFVLAEDIDSWEKGFPIMLIGGQNFTSAKESIIENRKGDMAERITSQALKEAYNVTSQNMPVYVNELSDLIHTLMPGIRTLFYVGGSDQFSSFKEHDMRLYVGSAYPEVELVTISAEEYSSDDLLKRLADSDSSTSAVLFSSWPSSVDDKSGAIRVNSILSTIATMGIPVFTLRDNGWMEASSDILGGYFVNEEAFFENLSVAVRDMMSGVAPRDIPDYVAPAPVPKLNYEKLLSFSMDPDVCPEGTEFTHKDIRYFKYFNRLKWVALLAILLVTIVWFLVWRRSNTSLYFASEAIMNMPLEYSRSKLIKDRNGHLVDFRTVTGNRVIQRMHKEVNEEIGAKTFREFYPGHAERFMAYLDKAYQEGKPNVTFSLYNEHSDTFKEFAATFLKRGMVCIIGKDITERERAKRALEDARIKAEEASMTKTRFLQNMSHELRTPLNAIVGFSQLLSLTGGEISDAERDEYFGYIQNNSDMLTMLIDDILDISDEEHGNYRVLIGDCFCNDICRKAVSSVEYRTPAGVNMYFTTDVPDDHVITSDGRRIQQVLVNYLTNACKHTTEGEIHLHCSVNEHPGKVTFSVSDTGTGVPPEKADVIFDRFTKLNQFSQGSGLGLNICMMVAEKLGGEVYLDKSYTGGARFVFVVDNNCQSCC